jgi:hypothetical protein
MIAPWAKEEMETVDLDDLRLDKRVVKLLSAFGERPNLSIPAACEGRAEMTAAYRFFDNEKVAFDNVVQPHFGQTRLRVAAQQVALLVQDTTETDVTRPAQEVKGVGELDGSRRGFLLHVLQAFTPDGTPLGTAAAEILNRTEGISHASASEKNQQRHQTPIEEKESMRWLTGLRQARDLAQQAPQTQCVYVADSEADIYELFSESRGEQPLHWLIRACQDRALEGKKGARVRDEVLASPVLYQVELKVRERQAKTAAEDRQRRQSRVSRVAAMEVRALRVQLRPPSRPDRKLPPVWVNVVLVSEPNAPAGEAPIEWMLLTTLPIDAPEQVRTVVAYYCVRWGIELLFRTLKSGCRIEERFFEHIDRLEPCVGLYLIVAWRVLFVCHLGRNCPDMDCEAIFEPSEWKAVWMKLKGKKPPKKAPRLSEMVHLIASLGGYVERPTSEPGTQTLWIGLQRMRDLAWAWDNFGPGAKLRNHELV